MLKFLSRKTKTEYVTPEFYKDWGNASYELDVLGRRLDAVRQAIKYLEDCKKPEDHWAMVQWRQSEAIILRKWKHTMRLKETGLRQAGKVDTGPAIRYDWWEGAEEVPLTFPLLDVISRWIHDATIGNTDLSRAWEMAREEKLQKARQGLA